MADEHCSHSESNRPSITFDGLLELLDYLKPHVFYQVSKFVPEELRDPVTGEVSTILSLSGILKDGGDLLFFHPSHEAGFLEACQQNGVSARRVNWGTDIAPDSFVTGPLKVRG